MRRFFSVLLTGLIAALIFTASAWAGLPPDVIRDPPDFQRFDPETPGLRIKRNQEQVEEFKRVPAPPEEPEKKPPPEKPPAGDRKNEK